MSKIWRVQIIGEVDVTAETAEEAYEKVKQMEIADWPSCASGAVCMGEFEWPEAKEEASNGK